MEQIQAAGDDDANADDGGAPTPVAVGVPVAINGYMLVSVTMEGSVVPYTAAHDGDFKALLTSGGNSGHHEAKVVPPPHEGIT